MKISPNTKTNMTPNSDAPDVDAPNSADYDSSDYTNTADDDATFPKLIRLSLRNRNRKISPNTLTKKKEHDLQH